MAVKTYNFQNPAIQKKASQKARFSARPKSYNSKSKILLEAKKELIKQELLKTDFIQQVGLALPQINKALIKNASNPKSGASDRKTVYSILGLLNKEDKNSDYTMGQMLAEMNMYTSENYAILRNLNIFKVG